MDKDYNEIIADLELEADYELVVSTARREDENGENVYLALVTVDGVTRGVVSRDGTVTALNLAADRALSFIEDEEEEDYYDEEDGDEDLFDRAVSALESAVSLFRRVRR